MEAKNVLLFVIIVVLLYVVILYISKDVSTLTGLTSGQTMQTITATSLTTSSNSGNTSNFSYSIWMYIDDWNYRYGEEKVVFGRMNTGANKKLEPCPSVVLGALENNIVVSLSVFPGLDTVPSTDTSTTNSIVHRCEVANVPIQKWVNLLVSTYGRSMDIYIDGKLVRTCVLPGVAKIDQTAPIYVTPNGGFSGWTAKFQYWSEPCDPQKAYNTYEAGYGASMLSSIFGKYSVKVSLMNGNTEDSSFSV
uniref:Concanavalin A-like lectin/glucanase domain-containing protein n=1 Tax=viral metagenome TaxID=1070528 RepID=A0A6C0I8V1_9ZZZZ